MKRSNRLILLIGVFLAALAFVIVVIALNGNSQTPGPGSTAAPPTKLATVVAARDIALGVAVTSDMLTTKTLETTVRLAGAFGDPSQVVGQVARQNIKRDQQLTTALFQDNGTVGSVTCPAGLTCMSVQVDQVSGVGTLIKSGDYVDVIAQLSTAANFPESYFVDKATTPTGGDSGVVYDPVSVKVLLQGLQVVNTLLPAPPTADTGTANASASPGTNSGGSTALNGQQEIVIIALTTQQAEVLRFVQADGNITLSLRSPLDFVDENGNPIVPTASQTTGVTLKITVDQWGVIPPAPIIVRPPAPAP